MGFSTQPLVVNDLDDLLRVGFVLDKALERETALNEYQAGCAEGCGECDRCLGVRARLGSLLTHPSSFAWEVFSTDPVDLAGILVLSRVDPGRDATAIFTFFDGKLRDKTEVLQSWFDWSFQNFKLNRITLEVPAYAFAALRHASKLGFEGPFEHEGFAVEGIKRSALLRDNQPVDMVVLGLVNE